MTLLNSTTEGTISLAKPMVRGAARPQITDLYLTARLALDDATRADAYAVRHESYLSGGYIEPQPGGLFSDADDLKPNSRTVVVYLEGRPVASVRLCVLDTDPALVGWDEIPASRIFPEAVAALAAGIRKDQPVRLMEINRLVRHPDFATNSQLVFVLFRFVSYMLIETDSDMMLSCVRRNHTPFYKRMHFEYVDGPRRYAGVKSETNLMSCPRSRHGLIMRDIPLVEIDARTEDDYAALFNGEEIDVFAPRPEPDFSRIAS